MTDPPYREHTAVPWGDFLAIITGVPGEVMRNGDRVRTFLFNESGAPRFMPFHGGTAVMEVDGQTYEFPGTPR